MKCHRILIYMDKLNGNSILLIKKAKSINDDYLNKCDNIWLIILNLGINNYGKHSQMN